MKTTRWLCAVVMATLATSAVQAQTPPKPGPEFDVLTKLVGNWDLIMKIDGAESKGTGSFKMELGGLWLTSSLESAPFGTKFSGRGLDTYDVGKNKYISVWVDSMSTTPMILEGTYDKATNTLTLVGNGPGIDGKLTKFKSVAEMPDDNTINFSLFMADAKNPTFTILYKRSKGSGALFW